jgi:hypothetical protein
MTDRLVQIDYIECDIPGALTLREYSRSLARERRASVPTRVNVRFRALAMSAMHRTPSRLAA